MGFAGFDSGFSLALPFLDKHGVMGSFLVDIWIARRFWIRVRWSQENPKGWCGDGFIRETLNWWVEIGNSSRDGEGILRHPSSVWFCDLMTVLGELTIS